MVLSEQFAALGCEFAGIQESFMGIPRSVVFKTPAGYILDLPYEGLTDEKILEVIARTTPKTVKVSVATLRALAEKLLSLSKEIEALYEEK